MFIKEAYERLSLEEKFEINSNLNSFNKLTRGIIIELNVIKNGIELKVSFGNIDVLLIYHFPEKITYLIYLPKFKA